MGKINKIIGFLAIAAVLLLAVSCKDDTEEEVDFEAYTDVYFLKKRIEQVIKYVAVYNVYGNSSIASAKVTTPDGEVVELESVPTAVYTYSKIPSEGDYSYTIPSVGDYHFTVISESGQTFEDSDNMVYDDILLPVIVTAGYNEVSYSMEVTWQPVEGADAYLVKLLDDDKNIMFNGQLLSGEATEYGFGEYYENWYILPYPNMPYTLQLQAIAFDSDATDDDYYYNVKEISVSEKLVVWGTGS